MTYIILSIGITAELILSALLVWGVLHKERILCFEDKIIFFIANKLKRLRMLLFIFIRNAFIFFYRPYRRMKKRLLKRLLRQFHLKAVRSEQVRGYEVLSR